ncbi:MAG: MFS transporter [Candidatus Korarchaeota archaeon NZ13-K]|nr:MAG: MFS transporter [Candidatus Korarchaeota archaeon NZ13-K]
MRGRSNVLVLSLTAFAIDTTFGAWWMILPLYLERLGASVPEVGISCALIDMAWAISQLPGGLLSDRFGRKRMIIISTSTFTPFYISMLLLKDWASATAALTLSSLFAGLQNPSFSSMIAESSEDREVARAFGIYNSLMNLGWALGPLLGAIVIPILGFDAIFTSGAIVTAICLLLRSILLSEPSSSSGKSRVPVRGVVIPIVTSILIFQAANGMIYPLIPIYAERVMGFNLSEVQLMFFAAQLLISLSSLAAGPLMARMGGLRGLLMSFLLSGASSMAWALSRSGYAVILLSIYYSSLFAFAEVAFSTLFSEVTTKERRATAFGAATVMSGLAHSAGSYLGGILWEVSDPLTPFLLAFSLMILSPLPMIKSERA